MNKNNKGILLLVFFLRKLLSLEPKFDMVTRKKKWGRDIYFMNESGFIDESNSILLWSTIQ